MASPAHRPTSRAQARRSAVRKVIKSSPPSNGATSEDIIRCVKALSVPVRRLRRRYPAVTILLAMLAQAATFLQALLREGILTRYEARRYCAEFTARAFARRRKPIAHK